MSRQCYLRCILGTHPPIKLANGIETFVGRNKITKIKDQACSRRQLSFKANCDECKVEIKQLGINPSGLNGFSMSKSGTYNVGHGSKIEIVLNSYMHVIEFEPPPEVEVTANIITGKRKLEDEEILPRKKQAVKVETENSHNEDKNGEDIWEEIDNGELYIYTTKGVHSKNKIAAFDMDGTLIKTRSGKVHPVDIDDWQILFPNISKKLRKLISDGFKVIILSNQAPIGNGRVKIADFKGKIEAIGDKLNVPLQAYFATGKGRYRKPMTGMWKYLIEKRNDGLPVDMDKSFYCGDAAGRIANWAPGKKKDHSLADTLLAENLGLKFFTPEQYFLGHSVTNIPMAGPAFNPKDVKCEPFNENIIGEKQELLVFVGYPASGKSYLAKQIEKKSNSKYVAVCRDVLGTWQRCAAKATELLKQGKSVIVDSTNPDSESRNRWTTLARDMKVMCRCIKMEVTKAHALHNNKFRELMKMNHAPVSEIVFHSYKNKFSEPITSEGFEEVITVNFSPTFEDKKAEDLYRMHLLEN